MPKTERRISGLKVHFFLIQTEEHKAECNLLFDGKAGVHSNGDLSRHVIIISRNDQFIDVVMIFLKLVQPKQRRTSTRKQVFIEGEIEQ